MNNIKLIIIVIIFIINYIILKKNYNKGLYFSIFFLVIMPRELFFSISDNFPTITGYRVIVMLLFVFSLIEQKITLEWSRKPLINLLVLIIIADFFSLIFAFNFSVSLNGFLILIIERFIFYLIVINAITNKEVINGIIKSLGLTFILIAILGIVERYTQFNPIDYISLPDNPRLEIRMAHAVYSTLPHPILFGTALAMGLPFCLFLVDSEIDQFNKRFWGFSIFLIIAGIYFSNSRGPWLATMIMVVTLLILHYDRIKVRLIPVIYLMVLILFFRPGVFNTIFGLFSSTLDENSLEGTSFFYRFELFKVAFYEIVKFPERVAFGYGDGAAHVMNLSGIVSYGSQREVNFWSWDSEFAVILLHNGFIGFTLNLLLTIIILVQLKKRIKLVNSLNSRRLISVIIASNMVLFFMMTNVAIFAPQVRFVMWTSVAIGLILSKIDPLVANEGVKNSRVIT